MASPRLELISKKLIKPFISTPPQLRSYKFNIIDQLMANMYLPMSFLYPNKHNSSFSTINIPTLLENSLSKVLTSYYPLAGRINPNNIQIDCNDIGATLIEAHANCKISEISSPYPNASVQDIVFPNGFPWRTKHEQSLLVAQLTHFDCEGKALSFCMSHKVGDAQTLCNFVRDWAAITRLPDDHNSSLTPQFNAASTLPPIEDPSIKPESEIAFPDTQNCITKRFIFDSKRLSQLKAKASSETGIQNPTRVEVVTAILYKRAYAATSMVHPNSLKPSTLMHPINMRSLIDPPFSSNSAGNLTERLIVPFPSDLTDLSWSEVASELRRAKIQFYEKFKGVKANDFWKYVVANSAETTRMRSDNEITSDIYLSTSLCRYPFYDIDFGWGNPDRIIFASFPNKNMFVLMDDQNGDGVEAFVSFEDKVMEAFESDPELLQFSSAV